MVPLSFSISTGMMPGRGMCMCVCPRSILRWTFFFDAHALITLSWSDLIVLESVKCTLM